jgi:hypothetical protein
MGETRNTNKILVRNHEGKEPLGDLERMILKLKLILKWSLKKCGVRV